MGENPTPTNKTLGVVESAINAVVMKVTAPLVVQMVSSIPQLAFLKIWPISEIFSALVKWILGFANVAFQRLGIKMVLTIQTDHELDDYSKAEGELRQALLGGDPNAIQKASDEFDKSLGNLIHWDGSSPIVK